MKTQINGITIAYSDRGTGLPIVFLHAFPLNRTMWAPEEEALCSQFRIITIHLRGHGESDAPLWRYTLEQSADDVCALLDQLAIQQAVFVGLSMGGYILFAFYRRYAARVKGLILADTKAQADTTEGKEERFQMAQTAYKKGPSAIADILLPKLFSPATIKTRPALVHQVRTIIENSQISGIAGDLMEMAERLDSIPLLSQITCPTQIIVGELDQATPPSDAKLMADQIPNARLAIISNAAHLTNLEQPEAFNQIVAAFASELAPKSIADRQPLYAETRHSQVKAEENEDLKPVFLKVEEWIGWDDERAAGCSKRFSSATAASEDRRRYPPHFVEPFAHTIDLGERKSPSSAFDL